MKKLKPFIKKIIKEYLNEMVHDQDYNISYKDFDDIKNSVWRRLAENGQEKKAIDYMIKYLQINKSKLEDYQIGSILWHIGQIYAHIDDYENAIKYMSMEKVQQSIEPNYQLGTIAFLKKDLKNLKKYYNILLKNDPTGGKGKDILNKFIIGFDKPYKQVY